MNYPIKYVADESGNRCLPITHIDAVKDDNGTTLSTLLSHLSTPIETPVNQSDATLPITALVCELGKYYRIDVAVETLDVILPAIPAGNANVQTIVLYLTGGTNPAVTIAATDNKSVYYQDGFWIVAGSTYEINALFNGAAWIVAAVKINASNS